MLIVSMAKQNPQEKAGRKGSGGGTDAGGGRLFGLADRLHSASIHLLRRVRSADRETGLSPQRLSALSVLVFGGPRSVGDLAAAEQVSAPTISRLVTGLEKQGLVRRRRSGEDQRVCFLEATPAGRAILEQGRRRRIEALATLLTGLAAKEIGILERAAALIEGLGGVRSAPPRGGRGPDHGKRTSKRAGQR
jgi:DNA-binding MarR family transcriptional regulator